LTAFRAASVAALALLAFAGAGCAGGGGEKTEGRVVAVALTDAGCNPAALTLDPGPVTFTVKNDGAEAVSEFEVLDGQRILGEVENLAPGLDGRFSLTLEPGSFTTYCPGGKTAERGSLVVRGRSAAGPASQQAVTAVARYRAYVEAQTALLVDRTRSFVAALRAGDLALAKQRYSAARVPYERIEPVAESFGNLDPAIDARAGDVPAAEWTGFHPIERALWVKSSLAGTGPLATRLMKDVTDLERRVRTVELEAAQIANGAVELLGEVSKSKITGEEERYSHIDLVDFEANVEGSREAFVAVRPIVAGRQPELAKEIDERFADVAAALGPYRRGEGFVSYTELTEEDTRGLGRSIDALAEPLSRVGAIVVAAG
jgi:iron uptake system component EfeO